MNGKSSRPIERLGKLALATLLTLTLAVTAAAQSVPAHRADERPREPGGMEVDAETYESKILERRMTPDGHINTVVEVPAEADTYIASEFPQQNFGAQGSIFLGYSLENPHFGAQRMLLRFDVEEVLPEEAAVRDARLRLYLHYSSPDDDVPMPTHLRQTAEAWHEHQVTWETEPEWGPIRAENEVGRADGWYEWDVTELVDDWMTGAVENHGMSIHCDERIQQRERGFYSREAPNLLYPRLLIEYVTDTEPPIVTVDPLPDFVGRDFTVSWSGYDPGSSGIVSYDVQYRVDEGHWTEWLTEVDFEAATFAATQHGRFYEFRARGTDAAGNTGAFSEPEGTTVDARSPTTTVDPLPSIIRERSFPVSWTGEDEVSGIHYFDVRYRLNREEWIPWQSETLARTMTFTAVLDGLYEFEARAVDHVGNVESFTGQAEASIIVDVEPPFVEPRVWVPLVTRGH